MPNYIVSDFVSRINVAKQTKLKSICIKPTKIILALLKIFEELGIIRGYFFLKEDYLVEVYLKYYNSRSVFLKLKVFSLPSKKVYVNLVSLQKLKEKYPSDIFILSTSKGLMLDVDCLEKGKSGMVLLKITI